MCNVKCEMRNDWSFNNRLQNAYHRKETNFITRNSVLRLKSRWSPKREIAQDNIFLMKRCYFFKFDIRSISFYSGISVMYKDTG